MLVSVDWTHGADHMWNRHKVSVLEANEAVRDIDGTRTWVLFKGSGTDTELLSRPM